MPDKKLNRDEKLSPGLLKKRKNKILPKEA